MAHGFFNIITADMINNLKGSHTRRPIPLIKSSHKLSTGFENALDDSTDNSDDPQLPPINLLERFHHHFSIQNVQKTFKHAKI